jgi:hypothetical protein
VGHPARGRTSSARRRRGLHLTGGVIGPGHPERKIIRAFEEPLGTDEGWAKYNRHYWQRDYEGFLR